MISKDIFMFSELLFENKGITGSSFLREKKNK